jgi:hypothetical protein
MQEVVYNIKLKDSIMVETVENQSIDYNRKVVYERYLSQNEGTINTPMFSELTNIVSVRVKATGTILLNTEIGTVQTTEFFSSPGFKIFSIETTGVAVLVHIIVYAVIPSGEETEITHYLNSYVSSKIYSINDLCFLDGIIYKSLQNNNTNHLPDVSSTYWQNILTWGNITGDIDDQTDLNLILNSKQDVFTVIDGGNA